jgi:transcriptional regulator with XRE-family HTH domain
MTARYLRAHRIARGLTQKALAARAGVGIMTVVNLEAGRRAQLKTLAKIASALSTHVQALRSFDPLAVAPVGTPTTTTPLSVT